MRLMSMPSEAWAERQRLLIRMAVTSGAAEENCRKPCQRDRETAFIIQQRTRRKACLLAWHDPEPTQGSIRNPHGDYPGRPKHTGLNDVGPKLVRL